VAVADPAEPPSLPARSRIRGDPEPPL